jgi:hypothetical protein
MVVNSITGVQLHASSCEACSFAVHHNVAFEHTARVRLCATFQQIAAGVHVLLTGVKQAAVAPGLQAVRSTTWAV